MTKEEILNKVGFDIDKAKAVYEWLNDEKKEDACNVRPNPVVKPVSIHYDINGNPDGVRVCIADEDFVIELHDAFDGNMVDFDKVANSFYNTFSFRQACFVCAYINEINKTLIEAGGESFLNNCYWINETSYFSADSHAFEGKRGYITFEIKSRSCKVRFIKQLKSEK